LYDRVTSPLSGTLIASWITWNWRIFYVTFFLDQEDLIDSKNKLDYIQNYLENPKCHWNLIWWPLITTAFFLVAFPFISRWAYKLHLYFQEMKLKDKIESENKIPLTLEESVKLRSEIRSFEEKIKEMNFEQESKISDFQIENGDLKDKNSKLTSEAISLKKQLEDERKEYDFSTLWKGDWIYESITDNDQKDDRFLFFQIENKDTLVGLNDKIKLRIKVIYRHRDRDFQLLLHEENVRFNGSSKLITINRAGINKYEGIEVSINNNNDQLVTHAETNKIRIYKSDELSYTSASLKEYEKKL
jgi:hypothetical protein